MSSNASLAESAPEPSSPRVLVVLSGAGYLDGAEITEAVVSLLSLGRAGARVQVTAPDKLQAHVVNHLTGEVQEDEQRNVMIEAARIARGQVIPLSQAGHEGFDALFMPGGYGAAKNLSSFAFEGPNASVDPDLARLLQGFHGAGKPIGAVCISPAVLVLGLGKGTVTIGDDAGTAEAIEAMGGSHCACPVTEITVDRENKVVTAPAYMYGSAAIQDVAAGIERAVSATLELL